VEADMCQPMVGRATHGLALSSIDCYLMITSVSGAKSRMAYLNKTYVFGMIEHHGF